MHLSTFLREIVFHMNEEFPREIKFTVSCHVVNDQYCAKKRDVYHCELTKIRNSPLIEFEMFKN